MIERRGAKHLIQIGLVQSEYAFVQETASLVGKSSPEVIRDSIGAARKIEMLLESMEQGKTNPDASARDILLMLSIRPFSHSAQGKFGFRPGKQG